MAETILWASETSRIAPMGQYRTLRAKKVFQPPATSRPVAKSSSNSAPMSMVMTWTDTEAMPELGRWA
jgi:hypothetical protein